MRSYWLKIVFGAAAIFAVGMLVVNVVKVGRDNVEAIAEGTGPISIPLFFVPLRVDGERVGTLRRLTVFRDSLQAPTRVEAHVNLADTLQLARLAGCILTIEQGAREGNVHPLSYVCRSAGDTVGADLVDFGTLEIRGRSESYLLYAPRAQVEEVVRDFGRNASASDSLARDSAEAERLRLQATADSIRAEAESLHRRAMERADSIQESAVPD
jgi:hypothetical protein